MTRSTNMEHVEVLHRYREWRRSGGADLSPDPPRDVDAALDAAIASLSAPQSDDWVLVRRSAIESAIETLENDGDEHGEGRNLRAAIDEAAAPPPPAEAQRCTCPSGDGSLRWPCPAHPPEAQAQGGGEVVERVAIALHRAYNTMLVAPDFVDGWPGWQGATQEEREFFLRHAREAVSAPPSAPVGVEDESVRVGNLPTMNQDGYPGLGEWWVQLWRGDEIIARVYGDGPDEARSQAQDIADAINQQPAAVQKGYKNGLNAALGVIANLGIADSEAQTNGREDAYRAVEALAAQQTAATLPDEDDSDLTVAYMAGRHDGRKEAQQPAAVDEAMVERALQAWFETDDWVALLSGIEPAASSRSRMRAALTAALAGQQGGGTDE